jgi:AcrR family transcriptional regulator
MSVDPEVKPARERILDAAAAVMRERGVANTTTKAIAAKASYSEAMLYKHFVDKQELFLLVLKERLPALHPTLAVVGTGDLATNIAQLVEQLMNYYAELFPMSVSIFSAPELLVQHREGVKRHGGQGPSAPIRMVTRYLDAERGTGRIVNEADTVAVAELLVGVAFHQGFLAAFEGRNSVPDAPQIAKAAVESVLSSLI